MASQLKALRAATEGLGASRDHDDSGDEGDEPDKYSIGGLSSFVCAMSAGYIAAPRKL